MKTITVDHGLNHHSSDGLSTIQRAVLRYLLSEPAPPNCAKLIDDLLAAEACPGWVTAESIDATILTMSHRLLARLPVLEYSGPPVFPDGWLPGPVYRSVGLGQVGYGILLLQDRSPRSWWSTDPLPLRMPFAMRFGSATWEIELQEGYADQESAQAERRLRCKSIHLLGCDEASMYQARTVFHEAQDLAGSMSALGPNGPFLACYLHYARDMLSEIQATATSTKESWHWLPDCHLSALSWSECGQLPHGLMIGIHRSLREHPNEVQFGIVSVPKIAIDWRRDCEDALLVAVEQPPCGAHLGETVEYLKAKENCLGLVFRGEELGTNFMTNSLSGLDSLRCEVPFIPLESQVLMAMLA